MTMRTDGMQGRDGANHGAERNALDDLFAEARAVRQPPSQALMARVLSDALDAQPRASVAVVEPRATLHRPGIWLRLVGLFGGAGALAGMGTAAMAGLFIGFVQPVGLSALGEVVLGTPLETVELIPSVDALLGGN